MFTWCKNWAVFFDKVAHPQTLEIKVLVLRVTIYFGNLCAFKNGKARASGPTAWLLVFKLAEFIDDVED